MAYVIIGNGIASLGAIDGIRKYDRNTPITVIGAENTAAYGKPLTSYLLAGRISPERLSMRPDDYYKGKNVNLKLATYINKIDLEARELRTSEGEQIQFEKLLLATGGKPYVPQVNGLEGEGVYNFTAAKDAYRLIESVKDLKRAVVIGGGLIGLKAAESLYNRGVEVAVVESDQRILPLAYDGEAAALIAKRVEEAGMLVRCGVSGKNIVRDKSGKLRGILLEDKSFLEADAIVIAIGVVSNTELAEQAGIRVDKGIVVDDNMFTGKDGIYAAGDVAQARDVIFDKDKVVPVWSNAYTQGYYAGRNMAGNESKYPGTMSMSSISFFGLPTISVGEVNPDPDNSEYEIYTFFDERKQSYRKLVFKKDQLVGYVLVGDIDFAGMYTSFIKFKFKVDAITRKRLSQGEPDVLMWPDEFFNKAWNPDSK
ncbi:NAD(P)/FAD-dependent oxidoreductase [Desulfovibrio sp. JC022]|uniref:NAD(P)/FAD-dependent oxidoreductase n=1 Tax=Desulfovibrio sp. JC022 TaxID=2593642 RepID=UPI0013D6CDDB|nr:FAD-dependent oxidoreductase [Desulfovibrio sp. JC022]NDV23558.1 NAD(P)/FAD-dependent oxidoreductase [Desulfovibrio sp. JC022]